MLPRGDPLLTQETGRFQLSLSALDLSLYKICLLLALILSLDLPLCLGACLTLTV